MVLGTWLIFDDAIIQSTVMLSLPEDVRPATEGGRGLLLSQIQNVASGALAADSVRPEIAGAAELLRWLRGTNTMALTVVFIVVAMLGGAWGWLKIAAANCAPASRWKRSCGCCSCCARWWRS